MIELKWSKAIENGVSNFRGDLMRFPESLSYNSSYYISSYGCPKCEIRPLYKLRTRGSVTEYNHKKIDVFNIFTCSECRIFLCSSTKPSDINHILGTNYTSIPLSIYGLISNPITNELEYKNLLNYTLNFKNG
jgi:hypothetical protein